MAGNSIESRITPPQEAYPSPEYQRAAEFTPQETATVIAGFAFMADRRKELQLTDNARTLMRSIMDQGADSLQNSGDGQRLDYASYRTEVIDLKAQHIIAGGGEVTTSHTLLDETADLPTQLDQLLSADPSLLLSLLTLRLYDERQRFERGNDKFGKNIKEDPVLNSLTSTIQSINNPPQDPDITSGREATKRNTRAA